MKPQRKIAWLALGIWLLLTTGQGLAAPQDEFILVVHLSNNASSISRKEAELIFLSKKRSWADGTTITVIINETPLVYRAFSQTILKRSTRQYLIFRKKMLFRGQGIPPHTVQTDQDVIDFVSTHSGSLGYINPQSLSPLVKTLAITP